MPGCSRPSDTNPLDCASDPVRPNYFGEPLKAAVQAGRVPVSVIDEKVVRVMTAMYAIGGMDTPKKHTPTKNTTSPERNNLARRLARESAVLLRNEDSILPLNAADVASGKTSIAVIGPAAHDEPISGGGGSGSVVPYYIVTVLDGILNAVASSEGAGSRNGRLELDLSSLQAERAAASGHPVFAAGACSGMECAASGHVSYYNGTDAAGVEAAARSADIAIVVLATTSHEGADRENLDLPHIDSLLSSALKGNPNTIAVVIAPGAFLMPYDAKALLTAWLPGQEGGNAIADLLFGAFAPSGRLLLTLPNKNNEIGFTEQQYPGVNNEESYSERLLVGYRWYTKSGVKPRYPFGFGLTYTTFKYDSFSVDPRNLNCTVRVTNTGDVDAYAVVGVYLTFPDTAGEPAKVLKTFGRAMVGKGKTTTMWMQLAQRDVSVYDASAARWTVVDGKFEAMLGESVQHSVGTQSFTVSGEALAAAGVPLA